MRTNPGGIAQFRLVHNSGRFLVAATVAAVAVAVVSAVMVKLVTDSDVVDSIIEAVTVDVSRHGCCSGWMDDGGRIGEEVSEASVSIERGPLLPPKLLLWQLLLLSGGDGKRLRSVWQLKVETMVWSTFEISDRAW